MLTKNLLFILALSIVGAPGTLLEARIGESRTQLDNRLLLSGLAIPYPEERVESKISAREMPYSNLVEFFPEGIENAVYFKKTGGEKPILEEIALPSGYESRGREFFPDGWDLHVGYLRGVSVFEAYRRNGPGLHTVEVEALLALNGDDWQPARGSSDTPSAFGYDYENGDGSVRARHRGNTLLIFMTKMDEAVQSRISLAKEEEAAEIRAALPGEIQGF